MDSWWHFDGKEVRFLCVCVFISHLNFFLLRTVQFGSFIELFALLVFIF